MRQEPLNTLKQEPLKYEETLQRMPIRTFRRSHVNEADLVLYAPGDKSFPEEPDIRASEQIIRKRSFDGVNIGEDTAGFFLSPGAEAFLDEQANRRHTLRIPKGHKEEEPIFLDLRLNAEYPSLVDDIVIEAEEGSRAVVMVQYTSEAGSAVRHCSRTRVIVRRNAELKLIKVQMLDETAAHTDAVGGVVGDGARLDVILAELGAAQPISGCNLVLEGEGAVAGLDMVYLGDGERSLDISCRAEHRGRKTVSRISAKGILLERSKKVFRDTLDFISGSTGSKGREEESILMLSPEVRNLSVPVLLCGEESVEGEHAMSSGRLDEKVLFYLTSRGFSEAEAKKMLAEAAVSSVVEKIPDPSIQDAIRETVRRAIEKGGPTA